MAETYFSTPVLLTHLYFLFAKTFTFGLFFTFPIIVLPEIEHLPPQLHIQLTLSYRTDFQSDIHFQSP